MNTVPVTPFIELVKNEYDYCKGIAAEGKKIIGYFCTYTPVELLHSMGIMPLRISGSSRAAMRAYSLVPSFICPYMRGVLEKGLNGEYSFLDGIVQGYTCDAACGIVNIWEENIGGGLFYSLPLPYNDNSRSRAFFRSRILDLIEKLESVGGSFSEERLKKSLDAYARVRQRSLDLYRMRYAGRLPLAARDFLYVLLAGFIAPPEKYMTMLDTLSSDLAGADAPESDSVPVFVSGSIIESPEIFEMIEASGGMLVGDDLCTGYRNLSPLSGNGKDPIDALIDRYMRRIPCPARNRVSDRVQPLRSLVGESGAKGVIFLFQKFCTPHLADHPALGRELRMSGVPSIGIEIEESMVEAGQMKTRLEGFIEMIRQSPQADDVRPA